MSAAIRAGRIIAATGATFVASNAPAQRCEWSSLGAGMPSTGISVAALTVFDEGHGEAIYAGGSFYVAEQTIVRHIARWDGRSWSALGTGLDDGIVYSLCVFDDGRGGGPALYAGGSFQTSGSKAIRRIGRWDGSSWSEVGGGVAGGSGRAAVHAMTAFDDGSGPALYVAGEFTTTGAGISGTNFIARWDGESWSSVGGGVSSYIYWLGVIDDGSGPALYASGLFKMAGGAPASYVAKWDGQSWTEVPGFNKAAAFVRFDDGSGPALYAAGSFTTAGGVSAKRIAKWDGTRWSELGGGLDKSAMAIAVHDDGGGPALYVSGAFTMAGETPASGIARWDGEAWQSLGLGVGGSPTPTIGPTAMFDDGNGPAMHVGGNFLTAGGVPASHVARWRCEQPAPCLADCDGSGSLDFFDFLCFQDLFAAGAPEADCDGSGSLDFFDFLCFQNAFVAGCP